MRKLIWIAIVTLLTGCHNEDALRLEFQPSELQEDISIYLNVVGASNKSQLVYNGFQQLSFRTDFGENDWLFTYDDSLKARYRFIKTNRHDHHDYTFRFVKENGAVYVIARVEGNPPKKIKFNLVENKS